jgi:poly-gamma-glutamate synthesis protein (capsule biosynthesis protein)
LRVFPRQELIAAFLPTIICLTGEFQDCSTLEGLDKAGIKYAGAGRSLREAQAPAILEAAAGSRVIVFSLGSLSSGIPSEWAALEDRPGINVIETYPDDPVRYLAKEVGKVKRERDVVIVSIHWGENWGYEIASAHRILAHRFVDESRVDVIHGTRRGPTSLPTDGTHSGPALSGKPRL